MLSIIQSEVNIQSPYLKEVRLATLQIVKFCSIQDKLTNYSNKLLLKLLVIPFNKHSNLSTISSIQESTVGVQPDPLPKHT